MFSLRCHRSRSLLFLTTLCLIVQMAMNSPARAGGAGPCDSETDQDCPFVPSLVCQSGPNAGLNCLRDSDCLNSTCIATTFDPSLPRVCSSGAHKEQECTSDSNCPGSKCMIAFAKDFCEAGTKQGQSCTHDIDCPESTCVKIPPLVYATLTLIVDDDGTDLELRQESRQAMTVLLEVENDGLRTMLAQTYIEIPDPDDNAPPIEAEFARTEMGLMTAIQAAIQAAGPPKNPFIMESLLNRLLFRDSRVSSDPLGITPALQLANELRRIFKTTGRPVIVDVPERIRPGDYTDQEASQIASVVRLRVALRFVKIEDN